MQRNILPAAASFSGHFLQTLHTMLILFLVDREGQSIIVTGSSPALQEKNYKKIDSLVQKNNRLGGTNRPLPVATSLDTTYNIDRINQHYK